MKGKGAEMEERPWKREGRKERKGENRRPTQPSLPPGSVNEYQLWLGRKTLQVWFIPLVYERGVCR